jgi:hypothetical protein
MCGTKSRNSTNLIAHKDEHNGKIYSTSRLLQLTAAPNFLVCRIDVRSKCFHHTTDTDALCCKVRAWDQFLWFKIRAIKSNVPKYDMTA